METEEQQEQSLLSQAGLSSPLYSIYKLSMEAAGSSWLTSCNTTTERFWQEVKEST